MALNSSTTDLTHYWTHMLEDMKSTNESEDISVSGVLPGDLCAYSLLRKLQQSGVKEENRPNEEEFLSDLRDKLTHANLEEAATKEGTYIQLADCNELEQALKDNIIDQEQFDMAYREAENLMKEIKEKKNWYVNRGLKDYWEIKKVAQ